MKKTLRAKVNLEVLNPQKHEVRFPTRTGLALGETVEDCIEEAKSIYNNGETRAISVVVSIDGETKIIAIDAEK